MKQGCPLCGGPSDVVVRTETSVTSESKVLDAASRLAVCFHCGHVLTALDLDLARYYASSYDAVLTDGGPDEIVSLPDGSITFRTDLDYGLLRDKVLRHVTPEASIFEYGCGHGRVVSRLVRDGFADVRAYDLGARYREGLARLIGDDRVFIGARPEGLQVDVACSFFVLEHDADPVSAIRYLRSVVRPGGRLFLMVPNFATNAADLACADHAHHFSVSLLRGLVEALGFSVLEVDGASSPGAMVLVARNDGAEPRAYEPPPDAYAESRRAIEPFLALAARVERLPERVPDARPVYLYGAGFYAAYANAALRGRPVAGVFDANPRKHGTTKLGCVVTDPSRIGGDEHAGASLVVCVNGVVAGAIRDRYRDAFADVICL
jgi:SAM-dependent methyltransferase